ncbi:MAG: class I fructose-bisphosphate aldolase, partial [Planctomycetota bacterium]
MTSIHELLGAEAEDLLNHSAKVSKDLLHLPGPDFVDRIWS